MILLFLLISVLKFGDDFVLGFHNVYKLKFADHSVKFELGVLVKELFFLIVNCNSL